jgi:hypothetical protein
LLPCLKVHFPEVALIVVEPLTPIEVTVLDPGIPRAVISAFTTGVTDVI